MQTVSKTAVLTLRARVDEHARPDRILHDPLAAEWFGRLEWAPELDAWYGSQYGLAYRADDIDQITRRFLLTRSVATIVELGAGLSTRFSRFRDLDGLRFVDLDLPEVAALRTQLGVPHTQIAASVMDFSWMDQLSGPPASNLFIIEGLLYYLDRAQVTMLLNVMHHRFPGSAVVMDVLGRGDFPKLLEMTAALGSPIQWAFDGNLDEALRAFGLQEWPDFEPDRLTDDALGRYWHRFDAKARGAIYFARHTRALWQGRSGVILGLLGDEPSAAPR